MAVDIRTYSYTFSTPTDRRNCAGVPKREKSPTLAPSLPWSAKRPRKISNERFLVAVTVSSLSVHFVDMIVVCIEPGLSTPIKSHKSSLKFLKFRFLCHGF